MQRAERYFQKILVTIVFLLLSSCSFNDDLSDLSILPVKDYPDRTGDFSLWQLGILNNEVQMGYILRTDEGHVIVVDGGGENFAGHVNKYIRQLGGVVHLWIITHAHLDHSGVLLNNIADKKIRIEEIMHSPLDEDWVSQHEKESLALIQRYNHALSTSGIPTIEPIPGFVYNFSADVRLIALGIRNLDIVTNAVNNSSLVFKFESRFKSVLFLGDLGPEGGNKLLNRVGSEGLSSDYVQMAHHGQRGVNQRFYNAVSPHYALWPTPHWLWENNLTGMANSGDWKIAEVLEWMNLLNVKYHYVAGLEGTVQID